MEKYKCVTTVQEIMDYIGDEKVVAFDYETAPDEPYRTEEKAALDPAKLEETLTAHLFCISERVPYRKKQS